MRLGIDFGTTRSIVAFADRGNFPVLSFINESGDATEWYPSVVAERQGDLRYGFDALQVASDPSWTLLRSFKRFLSDPRISPCACVDVGVSQIPIGELLTGFLAALRRDIIARSNLPKSVTRSRTMRAMIATPANAHSTHRFLTLDAFHRAGFEVASLLNEPSAAGFEYAHRYRSTITSRRECVVVYDLGGGTFDASLLHMSGQHHDVITTAGLGRLGGDDFDAVLLDMVLNAAQLTRDRVQIRALSLLTDQCRLAKEALNPNSKRLVIDLDAILGSQAPMPQVVVPVSAFYDACVPLVEQTIATMIPVMASMDADEKAADAELSDIAGIYVVGGASALPIVGRALRKQFGRRVHRSPYPSAATAIGLAIAGDDKSGFQLVERFSRNFGVFREAAHGARVTFDPIFTKETPLPTANHPFVSCRRYRPAHNVGHFRFVECGTLDHDGSPQGDITPFAEILFPFDASLRDAKDISQVPISRSKDEGPLIQEKYSLDSNGIVEVTITDLDTGFESLHCLRQ